MRAAHGDHRQARHPPRAGAGRGHHRRRRRQQDRRARRELGRCSARRQRNDPGRRLHHARSAAPASSTSRSAIDESDHGTADRHRAADRHAPSASAASAGNRRELRGHAARACAATRNTNIIATPSAVTMDNQEAELKVAQEVPFVTGQYTSTGTAAPTARSIPSRPSSAKRSAPSSRSRRRSTKATRVMLKIEHRELRASAQNAGRARSTSSPTSAPSTPTC